jgi:uncharacterized membrane protein
LPITNVRDEMQKIKTADTSTINALTFFHILVGAVALCAGAVTFCVRKGSTLHRRSGTIFVISMIAMGSAGAVIAALKSIPISVVVGAMVCYLVTTAYRAGSVRLRAWDVRDVALMGSGFAIAAYAFTNGFELSRLPAGTKVEYPAPLFYTFGAIAFVGALLDARLIIAGGVRGKHRLARHIWRMGVAMYFATAAFFLGQTKVLPAVLQPIGIAGIPVLLVVLLTFFWLARVLFFKWQMKR